MVSRSTDAEHFNYNSGNGPGLQANAFEVKIDDEIGQPEEQQNTTMSTTHELLGYKGFANAAFISNTVVKRRTPHRIERSGSIVHIRNFNAAKSQSALISTVLNMEYKYANSYKIRATLLVESHLSAGNWQLLVSRSLVTLYFR